MKFQINTFTVTFALHWSPVLSGDYEAAISEHQEELALSEVLNDVIGRAVANRKIGECYAELGNIEAALKVSTLILFEWLLKRL